MPELTPEERRALVNLLLLATSPDFLRGHGLSMSGPEFRAAMKAVDILKRTETPRS